jgi:hypothetical protein
LGEVDRREKAKSPGAAKSEGNYDDHDARELYRVGRVGGAPGDRLKKVGET